LKARYLFFGGKGGVGKTTAASATALYLLNKLKKDESILLFSTDPAHSLSDSLEVKIGNRLVEVKQLRGARLFAYEMDARIALERFREKHGKVLACATGDDQWSRDYWAKGFRLFAMGIDSMLLQGALKQGMAVLDALKSPGKEKGRKK